MTSISEGTLSCDTPAHGLASCRLPYGLYRGADLLRKGTATVGVTGRCADPGTVPHDFTLETCSLSKLLLAP